MASASEDIVTESRVYYYWAKFYLDWERGLNILLEDLAAWIFSIRFKIL